FGSTVSATGLHGGTDGRTFNVAVGAISVGVTVARAIDQRNTEAAITGGSTSTTGDVNVTADSTNTSVAFAPGATGGLVSLAFMFATARLSGHTSAQLDGSITSSASITVHALSEYRAKTQVVMGSVSLGGLSGAFSDAEVTSGAYTQASVGQFATLSSSGAVEVLAELKTANTFYPDNTPDRLLGKNGTTPVARN